MGMNKEENTLSSTCRALCAVSMPWFLRQLKALESGKRPTFQSETAALSVLHCNNKTNTYTDCKKIKVQYLPGNMIHGNAMLLHAILSSIVRRASYFIGRCRCTVYPPLQKNKFIFLCFFPHCLYFLLAMRQLFLGTELNSLPYVQAFHQLQVFWKLLQLLESDRCFLWKQEIQVNFQTIENKKTITMWIFQPRSH